MIGKITLVGAGPGDPELITLKGINAVSEADVILYDALIHPDILDYAKTSVTLIFVGKRANNHRYKQKEINRMLVGFALQGKKTVRLKGGDPYVFGRGHEELTYAKYFDLEVEVVPGITSAISVPQQLGIPVTRRGVSESFWVITATKSDGQLSGDIRLAASSTATLVLLMGVRKLREITAIFHELGKAQTPVAVIQNGTLPNENSVSGTFYNIVERVEKNKVGAPAIIIIGEVVRYYNGREKNLLEVIHCEKEVA